MRFRISELILVTAWFGFLCAGLVRADVLFECLFLSATIVLFFCGATLSIGLRGPRQAYWLALTLVGLCYLGLAHYPESIEPTSNRRLVLSDSVAPIPRHNGSEITTQLLRLGLSRLHPTEYQPLYVARSGGGGSGFSGGGGGVFNVASQFGGAGNNPPQGLGGSMGGSVPNAPVPLPAPTLFDHMQNPIMLNQTSVPFMRIGHCGWALLFGWIAGHVAQATRRKSIA